MKILSNLCLHFARQDGQDRKKSKENHTNHTKVTKNVKNQKTEIWDDRNKRYTNSNNTLPKWKYSKSYLLIIFSHNYRTTKTTKKTTTWWFPKIHK